MKFFLIRVLFYVQIFLYEFSFFLCSIFSSKKEKGVIIGNEEIASILYSLGRVIPDSKTVNTGANPYYTYRYDFNIGKTPFFKSFHFILTPILLGYLVNRYKTFIYISASGFLVRHIDGREYEFKSLKKRGCNIICYFTGSDIRSFELMRDFSKNNNMDTIATYQCVSHKGIDSPINEEIRKKSARVAEKYADIIFNPNIDQMSYIKRETHPPLYFADDAKIIFFPKKFENNIKKTIVHAPSSPIIKGTPIVRAAVKKLQEEGYDFEYVELIGVSNTKVLEELQRAHIVLNEFYAFVPGVFGIEAMMNNAVLLTSADKNIEPSLFEGANEAWVVTPYWKVYDNLKEQLDKPMKELKIQADRGTEWVRKYCSYSFSSTYLKNVINSLENND